MQSFSDSLGRNESLHTEWRFSFRPEESNMIETLTRAKKDTYEILSLIVIFKS